MNNSKNILIAGILLMTGAPLAAVAETPHGVRMQGPGIFTFKICPAPLTQASTANVLHAAMGDPGGGGMTQAPDGGSKRASTSPSAGAQATPPPASGCDITANPRSTVQMTMEVWGGGGGGGAGAEGDNKPIPDGQDPPEKGRGGGGGGGGGYGKTVANVTVPLTGSATYVVKVGSGGAKGLISGTRNGGAGEKTEIHTGSLQGPLVIQATGGTGGNGGSNAYGATGGSPGSGSANTWTGLNGSSGQYHSGCNGGDGGLGGPGGGPGRTGPGYINDGGNGGHGGYSYGIPACTTHGANFGMKDGSPGGNGQVKLTW